MKVSALDSGGLSYLRMENYGNMFNFDVRNGYTYSSDSIPKEKTLRVWPSVPAYDHNGNRWQLYSLYDTTTEEMENWLIDNKITLHFYLENIRYYLKDLVPYHSASHTHYATKIE